MEIERIDHIHFAVNNIKKYQEAFTRLLGLKFTPIEDFPKMDSVAVTSIDPVEFAIVKPTSPDTVLAKDVREKGEGLHSFCLKISDFDEVIADFKARKIKHFILPERKRFGKDVKIVQIDRREANGVLIELTEY